MTRVSRHFICEFDELTLARQWIIANQVRISADAYCQESGELRLSQLRTMFK